ncbi:hypothetical protein LCGC14_3005320, partial [marine sediment metagenome]
PKLIIMTGNPFTLLGEFYESHHQQRGLWNPIGISAFDTPNLIEGYEVIPGMVTQEDVDERAEEWGEDSALYITSILGQFADSLSDSIVPLNVASAVAERAFELVTQMKPRDQPQADEGNAVVVLCHASFSLNPAMECTTRRHDASSPTVIRRQLGSL